MFFIHTCNMWSEMAIIAAMGPIAPQGAPRNESNMLDGAPGSTGVHVRPCARSFPLYSDALIV